MGLCKCPKRRVTNLFCFVHRVNVCEDCMISGHSRCVVQSYIQWLQDSDYEPVCHLCTQTLDEGDVIRLACHDLFHLTCLDNYVNSRPSGATLGSLVCPTCKEKFFPSPNQVSPVVDKLRLALRSYHWGREGLGINDSSDTRGYEEEEEDEILTTSIGPPGGFSDHLLTSTPRTTQTRAVETMMPTGSHAGHVNLQLYEDHPVNRGGSSSSVQQREQHQNWSSPLLMRTGSSSAQPDSDDNKYKRRSLIKGVVRWLKQNHLWISPLDDTSTKYRRLLLLLVIACVLAVMLILFMTRVGETHRDPNTALDWNLIGDVKTGN